jgi:hypothetical protein
MFHRDYMSNCRLIIANRTLVNANNNEAKSYMNFLWAVMVKDNCYQEWMCQKRWSIGTKPSRMGSRVSERQLMNYAIGFGLGIMCKEMIC